MRELIITCQMNRENKFHHNSDTVRKLNSKKAKMGNASVEELEQVKDYLSRCTSVPQTSNAIRVAIAALDQELKRINRDEKLRLKFSTSNDNIVQDSGAADALRIALSDDSMVHVTAASANDTNFRTGQNSNCISNAKNSSSNDEEDDALLNEWQDVEADESSNMQVDSSHSNPTMSSPMGVSLLKTSLQDMSSAHSVVSTPTGALSLILHSALRSKLLGFKCTGIPDDPCCFKNNVQDKPDKKKTTGPIGFAASIRELPRGAFLPKKWDDHASLYHASNNGTHRVILRYSKIGMPVTILKVETIQDRASGSPAHSNVKISFGPLGGEPCEMIFPIDQHVNLEALHAATVREGCGVKPTLHYKALSGLLTEFCNKTDLGVVDDGTDANKASGIGVSENDLIAKKYTRNSVPIPLDTNTLLPTTIPNYGPTPSSTHGHPPTIRDDLQRINYNHGRNGIPGGDFSDDLLPSGLPLPGFSNPMREDNGMTGNLMGPNHPAFHPQFNNEDDGYNGNGDFMPPGGLGMQPRFDLYLPPGVGGRGMPGRIGRGRGRGRRGGRFPSGDPNPDHQRLPNTFGGGGDNMFM